MPKGMRAPTLTTCRACDEPFETMLLGRAAWYCRRPECRAARGAKPIEHGRTRDPSPEVPGIDPPPPTTGEPVRLVVGDSVLTTLDGATVRAKVGLPLGAVLVTVPVDDGFEIVGIERAAPQVLSPMMKALLRKRELLTGRVLRQVERSKDWQRWIDEAEDGSEMASRLAVANSRNEQLASILQEVEAYNDTAAMVGLPLVRPPDTMLVSVA